ncbi:MAG: hypothetical protein JSR89_08235 [Proteobacteria bacterium]|nr:hypothetical protein [Pseudomonadota bacterium]
MKSSLEKRTAEEILKDLARVLAKMAAREDHEREVQFKKADAGVEGGSQR